MRRIWGIVGALVLLGLAACGGDDTTIAASGDPSNPAPSSTEPRAPDPEQRYQFIGTVLDDGESGPKLCARTGASRPPYCDGEAEVIGLDWTTVEHDSYGVHRWANSVVLIGTWDGRFTLTEPPRPQEQTDRFPPGVFGEEAPPLPCPEPEGGWETDIDPMGPGDEAAYEYLAGEPDVSGQWYVDGVYVVSVTDRLAVHEQRLRELATSPVCVVARERTDAELRQIIDELQVHEPLWWNVAPARDGVTIGLWVVDPALQAEVDDRYGHGVVRIVGQLQPVSG